MPVLAFFGWIIIWALAKGYEGFKERQKQHILDENPYWEYGKSEAYLAKHGLTQEQSSFQGKMRNINKRRRYTPEETAKDIMLTAAAITREGCEPGEMKKMSYNEVLEKVNKNWYCLKEIDEKPQYRYKTLPGY